MESISEPNSAILLERLRTGEAGAAEEIFSRYLSRLTALARVRLSAKLASRTDAEDVVMSAYRSFFVGAAEGRFHVQRSGDLWRLLVSITLHKLYHQAKHHQAALRSLNAESRLEDLPTDLIADRRAEPTPLEALALADEVEQAMAPLDSFARRVFELRLQGYALDEIASETGRSERTVRRTLCQIRAKLASHFPSVAGLPTDDA